MNHAAEIIYDLRTFPCLSSLEEKDLSSIVHIARLKRISKNNIIFEESEPVKSFFIVKEGAVKLYKTSPEGRELIVKIIEPGDFLCYAPFSTDRRHPVSARSLKDSTLIVIPAGSFREILLNSLGELGMKIIVGLCNRIGHLSNLVEDLTFKDVEQRVIATLLRLAEEKSPGDDMVTLTVTHQDIASLTGTVREVVSRTMSKLKNEGVITDSSVKSFKINRDKLSSLINRKNSLNLHLCDLSH